MIEPNMATMLSYLLTDLSVPRDTIARALKSAVHSSFNCVSIDGDQSTSDTVLCLSSGAVEAPGSDDEFQKALMLVCQALARDMVRNGEGTQHVLRCSVLNAPSDELARCVPYWVSVHLCPQGGYVSRVAQGSSPSSYKFPTSQVRIYRERPQRREVSSQLAPVDNVASRERQDYCGHRLVS
jgi:hypothetical protein